MALADFHDLFAEIPTVKQAQKCLWHALDALEHVLFESDLAFAVPGSQPPQRFVAAMPPIKYEKAVDAGAAYDQLAREPLANVGFAELARERDAPGKSPPARRY